MHKDTPSTNVEAMKCVNNKTIQMKILQANIDVNKIDESRLVAGKNGRKYLNVTIFVNDEENAYGYTVDIQQSQSKDEREAGMKKNYLGNGIITFSKPQR